MTYAKGRGKNDDKGKIRRRRQVMAVSSSIYIMMTGTMTTLITTTSCSGLLEQSGLMRVSRVPTTKTTTTRLWVAPYVETYEHYIVGQFWESQSFDTSRRIVDSIIDLNSNVDGACRKQRLWLQKLPSKPCHNGIAVESKTGYEDLFDNIYIQQHPKEDDSIDGRETGEVSCESSELNGPSHQNQSQDKVQHFKIQVAYRGDAFCGYQIQPKNKHQPSVQETLESCLTDILYPTIDDGGEGSKQKIESTTTPMTTNTAMVLNRQLDDVDNTNYNVQRLNKKLQKRQMQRNRRVSLKVAGRTDAGVSAIGQICRLRVHRRRNSQTKTWNPNDIETKLRRALRGTKLPLCVTNIAEVDRSFHPSFTSSCRAYVYLVDLKNTSNGQSSSLSPLPLPQQQVSLWSTNDEDLLQKQVLYLNSLLQALEGRALNFIGLSYGRLESRDSIRTLYHARARLVRVVAGDKEGQIDYRTTPTTPTAICIELVGNGFLRRMVRFLVQCVFQVGVSMTGVCHDDEDGNMDIMAAVKHVERRDRKLLSSSAPPFGLIFVGAR